MELVIHLVLMMLILQVVAVVATELVQYKYSYVIISQDEKRDF
jgi:hypothetical protein